MFDACWWGVVACTSVVPTTLAVGQNINLFSPDGSTYLVQQGDGNVVL